jgi:hypothetical protein
LGGLGGAGWSGVCCEEEGGVGVKNLVVGVEKFERGGYPLGCGRWNVRRLEIVIQLLAERYT